MRSRKTGTKFGIVLALVVAFVGLVGAVVLTPGSASAVGTIEKKILMSGVYQCYQNNAIYADGVTADDYNDWGTGSIINYNGTFNLPTEWYKNEYNVTCGQLFNGDYQNYDNFKGVFSMFGVSVPDNANDTTAFNTFMTGMGYTRTNSSTGLCASFVYNNKDGSQVVTKMCADTNGTGDDAVITSSTVTISGNNSTVNELEPGINKVKVDCNTMLIGNAGGCGTHTFTPGQTKFSELVGAIYGDMYEHHRETVFGGWTLGPAPTYEPAAQARATYNIKNGDMVAAAKKAIKFISGTSYTYDSLKLSPAEQVTMLQDYLRNFYHIDNYGCDLSTRDADTARAAGYQEFNTNMFSGSEYQVCWVKPDNEHKNYNVWAFDSDGFYSGTTTMDFSQIIDRLKGEVNNMKDADKAKCNSAAESARKKAEDILDRALMGKYGDRSEEMGNRAQATIDELDNIRKTSESGEYWREENGAIVCYEFTDASGNTVDTPTDSPDNPVTDTPNEGGNEGEVSSMTACYESAGVLGWIACPVLEVMSGVTTVMYDFVEGSLTIGSDLMGANGLQRGWEIFRDFANILFAIAFLLVILSQVTGIGITNYGIKKVLPRLIMVAVLVNISFILCQLAVDASNIIGSNIKSLFDGFSKTVAESVGGVPFNLGTVVGGLAGTSVAIGGVVAVTAVLALTIPFELWLFPIFLAILGCAISVFFFFVILGVRQAGVVVLITLAPVAIICYVLPNTKFLFDRWKKMLTALLLVYPICGLLVGGGNFASTLLLSVAHESDASGFFVISAMLMSVVPFFMIPSILKGSMSAMGNLGMKIAGFGSKFGNMVTGGIRNSELGRDIQRRANMNYLDRAGKKIENQQGKLRGKVFSGWKAKRLGRYNTAYNRYSFEDIRAGGASSRIVPTSPEYESLVQGQKSEQFDKDVAGRQSLYKNGLADSNVTSGTKVNGNDEDAMIAELDSYLNEVITGVNGGATVDSLSDKLKNAQAIINTLSDTGRGSTMAKVENSFLRALQAHGATMSAATGDKKANFDKSFGALGTRTNQKYGAAYKKISPGAAAMFGDISKGQYGRAGTIRSVTDLQNDGSIMRDSAGNPITHLASSTYSRSGLSGINPEDLSKMKAHHHANILDGITNGDISGSDALDLVSAADEVLAHPEQFATDADAKAYIERIRNAALSSGTVPTGGTRTTGAMALGRASSSAVNNVLNSIQGAQNWGSLSADDQARYGQLVANIHDSLNNDMHTAESAEQLKQALSIAKSKGFIDASTSSVVDEFTGTPTLKITRATRQKAPVPTGWTESGMWVGGGVPTKQQQIAYEEWAKHSANVDIHNSTP